jgi:Tol biopolymer transport system component
VEASRLRTRLEAYYAKEGASDTVVITLPKGGYVPLFGTRQPSAEVTANAPEVPVAHSRMKMWYALGAIAIAIAMVAAAVIAVREVRRVPAAAALPVVRVDIALGSTGVLASQVGANVALSPDGTRLVFLAQQPDGTARLYARRLDQLSATELPGTIGAGGPFFSPDGRWVGFWAEGKLKKTLVEGSGSPVVLCEATDLLGASWGDEGYIVATLNSSPRLWRVPAAGGAPTVLFDFRNQPTHPRWPQVLPGGKAVLYTAVKSGGSSEGSIEVALRDAGPPKTLVRGGLFGRYVESGHLLYVDRGVLFAVPFDLDRLEVRGEPVAMLNDVSYSSGFGFAHFAVARNGTLVYQRASGNGLTTIRRLDASNASTAVVDEPARYQWPRVSPDGRQLAFSVLAGSDFDIWIYDISSGRKTRVADGDGDQSAPVWTTDGRFIVYLDDRGPAVFWRRSDARGRAERLLPAKGIRVPWSFAPESRRLAFHQMSPDSGFDLWTVGIDSDLRGLHAGEPELFWRTRRPRQL